MPAAGVYVALIGLICINLGINKIQKNRFSKEKEFREKTNDNCYTPNEKTYRIVTNILYLSNFILVMFLLPDFSHTLGDNYGFFIRSFIGMVAAVLCTGVILSLFKTISWIAIVGLLSWAPLFYKVLINQ